MKHFFIATRTLGNKAVFYSSIVTKFSVKLFFEAINLKFDVI
jgi:hypothetical protein